jgi:hypothetical protein
VFRAGTPLFSIVASLYGCAAGMARFEVQRSCRVIQTQKPRRQSPGGVMVVCRLIPCKSRNKQNRSGLDGETLSRPGEGIETMSEKQTFASIWDAIEDTPAEAENMRLRSALMRALESHIRTKSLSQTQADRPEHDHARSARVVNLAGMRAGPEHQSRLPHRRPDLALR